MNKFESFPQPPEAMPENEVIEEKLQPPEQEPEKREAPRKGISSRVKRLAGTLALAGAALLHPEGAQAQKNVDQQKIEIQETQEIAKCQKWLNGLGEKEPMFKGAAIGWGLEFQSKYVHHEAVDDEYAMKFYTVRLANNTEFDIATNLPYTAQSFEEAVREGVAKLRGFDGVVRDYSAELPSGVEVQMDAAAKEAMKKNGIIISKGILYAKGADGATFPFNLQEKIYGKVSFEAEGDGVRMTINIARGGNKQIYKIHKGVLSQS
ncbi:MAG TPA: hypothetical protein VMU07_03465 [Candidatus Paceibacterota bacterium]|nr:hypothetical protein [Candidatus Paceibacterota bacterium]